MSDSRLLPIVCHAVLGSVILAVANTSVSVRADDAAAPAQTEQVIVVFKTHFDIGYTDLARNVLTSYRTSMIDQALEVCDRSRSLPPESQFVWTVPGWPMAQILWPGQTPERRERILQAIRDGRLVWHALPGSLHTESLDLEDIVRGLRFSSELSRGMGMPLARDAKMTDVPSHVWSLPTILKHAGIEFLHIGCNSASASPDVPRLFWWEGPDGSRLLTMYEAGGYGSGLKPPADWPYKTWLAMIHSGDNQGPPTPEQVEALLAQARQELPGVKLRMGRLSDFADAILAEKAELPVVRADMPDTWIHGIMSMPIETKIARNLRPEIAALEASNTLLQCWGLESPQADQTVRAAYEGSLMVGEHTWGGSFPLDRPRLYGQPWREALRAGQYAHLEESWREHGQYIRDAQQLVAPALAGNLETLARSVDVDGRRIIVFNPLPWIRDDVVTFEAPSGIGTALKEVTTGEVLPVERDGQQVRFIARQLPPLGYRTYVPAEATAAASDLAVDANQHILENAHFRLKLDPARGVVASLVEKQTGRELVDQTSSYGLGQYLYERLDAENNRQFLETYCKERAGWIAHFARADMPPASEAPYSAASPKDFALQIHRGEVSLTATMTAAPTVTMPHQIALEVTLYRDQPWVDLQWRIMDKEPETWPEAGWLCLPLAAKDPTFCLGRLGALVDPARDIVRSSNHEVFCLNSGMAVTGADHRPIGLCPIDSPLVSLGQPGLYRYSREFTPRKPVVLVNLFNNVWGTNFQQWIGGSWSSRVRLWAAQGRGAEADLITPAWEARSRAKAATFVGSPGKLPPVQFPVELSRKGVLVTAFGHNPDGDGILLRLWEQAGEDGSCRVRLPEGLHATVAQPCDLRGRPQGTPIAIQDGWLEVAIGPFAPVSLLLQPAAP